MSKVVECLLCDKLCRLGPDQRGDCRVRVNLDGRLVSLVYGKVCAQHIDPIEKKPMFHYLPGSRAYSIATAGCNLHCKYCQNWEISQLDPEEARNIDLPPEKLIEEAQRSKCQSIAYTYTDPIIFYEYVLDSIKLARTAGLGNILVTAGFIRPEPLEKLLPYVDGANVDLKAMSDKFYREVCDGRLQPVLNTIRTLKNGGCITEITNLLVPTLNDETEQIKRLIDWVLNQCGPETPLHFSRFFPTYKLQNLKQTPVQSLKDAYDLARSRGLHYVYVGNVRGGFGENTSCPNCGEVLIERTGYYLRSYKIDEASCSFCGQPIYGKWL